MIRSIIENIEILDAGAEGKAIARVDQMVIFVPFVVPGDVVDIEIIRKKKSYIEGKAVRFHHYSEKRVDPFCTHFGTCGGCRWQNMKYEEQLFYKQKQVEDSLTRIGKIGNANILPILPSTKTTFYRNKLEYAFSNHRWLATDEKNILPEERNMNALGFHLPLFFDRVLDIKNCHLQPDPSNAIRLEAKKYAQESGLSFYDVRKWQGFLRNLIIRTTRTGDLMVIVIFRTNEEVAVKRFLDHLIMKFPEITSLYYVINDKKNDFITDLPFHLFKGKPYIIEKMNGFGVTKEREFRIGPSSFFQTNPAQAEELYHVAAEFAGLTGTETVYDLYTGTGTVANYIAGAAKKVIGLELVEAAIMDARENSRVNGIGNTFFVAGEAEKILTSEFLTEYGTPDVIITDPPRAGMHEKVVRATLLAAPQKIVYISCNPATQARDILLLGEKYQMIKCQPVDMFPHTHHVENVALLELRN